VSPSLSTKLKEFKATSVYILRMQTYRVNDKKIKNKKELIKENYKFIKKQTNSSANHSVFIKN